MAMSSPCETLNEALPTYVDGELPAEEARSVESHLHACQACADRVRELRDANARVRNLGIEPLSELEWQRLRTRALAPELGLGWRHLAAAAVAAVLLPAALALVVARPSSSCQCDVVAPAIDLGL